MEPDFEDLSLLFPNLAAQLRNTLSTMHLAASQLAPSRQREQDPALDARPRCWIRAIISCCAWPTTSRTRPCCASRRPHPEGHGSGGAGGRGLPPLRAAGRRAGADAAVRVQHGAPCVRRGTRELERLLYHLLSNAFKFTPAGGTVTVELKTAGKQVLLSGWRIRAGGIEPGPAGDPHLTAVSTKASWTPGPTGAGTGPGSCAGPSPGTRGQHHGPVPRGA